MIRHHVLEDAERVLITALSRWRNEFDSPSDSAPDIVAVHSVAISHSLLGFRINHITRVDIDAHTAPAPITDFWLADVTLALTPRPVVSTPLTEIRALTTSPPLFRQVYDVKRFLTGEWLVFYHYG